LNLSNGITVKESNMYGKVEYNEKGLIICEICKKSFSRVCTHVRQKHGISALEYKEMYGLDKTKGLCSLMSSLNTSVRTYANYDKCITGNLFNKGMNTRFINGHKGRTKDKMSEQTRLRLCEANKDFGNRVKNHIKAIQDSFNELLKSMKGSETPVVDIKPNELTVIAGNFFHNNNGKIEVVNPHLGKHSLNSRDAYDKAVMAYFGHNLTFKFHLRKTDYARIPYVSVYLWNGLCMLNEYPKCVEMHKQFKYKYFDMFFQKILNPANTIELQYSKIDVEMQHYNMKLETLWTANIIVNNDVFDSLNNILNEKDRFNNFRCCQV